MKRILSQIFVLSLLLVAACASKRTENDAFNQATLERARAILDAPSNDVGGGRARWPEVDGFELRLSGVPSTNASPELWALYTIRFIGEQKDATRCLRHIQSDTPIIRDAAEKSFVALAMPKMSQKLLGLLESNDDRLRKLALAYSGWQGSDLSEKDLQILMGSS